MSDLVSLDECFLSVSEILALECPSLPKTDRRLADYIERHNWRRNKRLARQRSGRGGGWEYHYLALPAEAQSKFLAGHGIRKARADHEARRETLWLIFERATDAQRDVARRRLDAINRVDELRAGGMLVKDAVALIASGGGFQPSTIFEWIKRTKGVRRDDWLPALIAQRVGRTTEAGCDPEAWEAFKADCLRPERPAIGACFQRLVEIAAVKGWTIPSEKTLRRRLAKIPATTRAFLLGDEAALDKLYPYQTRDKSSLAPLQVVNLDGHRLDVMARWPDGAVGRPMLIAVQDVYSGMIVGHRLGRNEDWPLVRLALLDMIETFGIPETVSFDNSRANASKWISGRNATRFRHKIKEEEPQGVLGSLNVKIQFTRPYSGRSKPIERANRDFAENISKHPACAGAYTGNKPDAKPANYGSKAIDSTSSISSSRTRSRATTTGRAAPRRTRPADPSAKRTSPRCPTQ